MKYTMVAMVLAFLFAMQSAFAAKTPSALPGAVKAPAQKQKVFAPPVMQETSPKAAAPVVVATPNESAFEQGSESAARAEEPEASLPETPASNAIPAPVVFAPKTDPKAEGKPQPTLPSHPKEFTPAPAPAAEASQPGFQVKKTAIELEQDDGELGVEADLKLRPLPPRGSQKLQDPDYIFTDEELGITPYLGKKQESAESVEEVTPVKKVKELKDSNHPLVELPEPMDGYAPELQEGKSGESDEAAEKCSPLLAGAKNPGSVEFDMDTVEMLSDSIEPTGEVANVAKRK